LASQDTALLRFAADLRRLREKAGNPTYRELSKRAHYSAAALSEAAGGRKLPSLAVTLAYVNACCGDPDDWQARWQAVMAESATDHGDPCVADDLLAPYVGLAAFQPADADWFFGRDRVVDDLLARVRERRFIGVFGASGSGKSSVLRAGLVARARTSGLSAAGPLPTLLFTPGAHPLEECAVQLSSWTGVPVGVLRSEFAADPANLHLRVREALADRPADVDLVLVIDQFEEVFTLCAAEEERARFIAALVFAATATTSRVRVVLGIRADFYGYCGRRPELVAALRDAQVLIGSMTTDELREAIAGPAAAAGAMVESALMTRLIADVTGQPGVLPLLSHALLETWRRRRGATLTLAGYEAAGGIRHAIARSAEHVHTTLTAAQQAVAKQVFLRLTALGEATEDTKRRVSCHELDEDPDAVLVLDKLTDARLVVADRGSVDIAHEALIRYWPRLHGWLTEDREGLRIHRQLTDATQAWEFVAYDPGALYRGTRLAMAHDWATTHDTALTTRERAFLDASSVAETDELTTSRRHTRRLHRLVALLATLLLVATTTTVLAVRAQDRADQQHDVAVARKVIQDAAALRATDPALAVQLSLAAYRLAPGRDTGDNLLNTFATPYATRLTGHTGMVLAVAFRDDGRVLATAGVDHTVRLWDVSDTYHPTALATLTGDVVAMDFSPDGRTLAMASTDQLVRLWDVADVRQPRASATLGRRMVYSVAFSPDGRTLVTTGSDQVARLWDVTDTRHPAELAPLTGHAGAVYSAAFSPDGHTLATAGADQLVRLWDVTDLRSPRERATLTGHTDTVWSVAFSPDGRTLATASWDHTARLWDVADPGHAHESATLTGHTSLVLPVAFSPDGRILATAGADNRTRLWDVSDPRHPGELPTFAGDIDAVRALAFSPDGRTLVTADGDDTARLVRLSDIVPAGHTDAVNGIAFSPDGRLLATADQDHTARLLDVSDSYHPRELATLANGADPVLAVAFSPGGRTLATTGTGRETTVTRLWDVSDPRNPKELVTLTGSGRVFASVAFSPDGHILAAAGGHATTEIMLWDVSEPRRPRELGTLTGKAGDGFLSVAFSPNGRALATANESGISQVWDVSDARHPRQRTMLIGHTDAVSSVVFGPDNHTLATASLDHTVRLSDISDARHPRDLAILTGHADAASLVAFSPDGHALAVGGGDKDRTARLWDISYAHRPRELATLTGHTDSITFVAFSPGGHILATASADHTVRLWDTDIGRVATHVCDIATPPITRAEWDRYFPGVDYQPPCT
jgi:WD40 repeat protein/energy-coupling factor transporter ATP-binding protein EcfA2